LALGPRLAQEVCAIPVACLAGGHKIGEREKRMSNQEWKSPSDQDARIAKIKDGRTHLAQEAEHAGELHTWHGGGRYVAKPLTKGPGRYDDDG